MTGGPGSEAVAGRKTTGRWANWTRATRERAEAVARASTSPGERPRADASRRGRAEGVRPGVDGDGGGRYNRGVGLHQGRSCRRGVEGAGYSTGAGGHASAATCKTGGGGCSEGEGGCEALDRGCLAAEPGCDSIVVGCGRRWLLAWRAHRVAWRSQRGCSEGLSGAGEAIARCRVRRAERRRASDGTTSLTIERISRRCSKRTPIVVVQVPGFAVVAPASRFARLANDRTDDHERLRTDCWGDEGAAHLAASTNTVIGNCTGRTRRS